MNIGEYSAQLCLAEYLPMFTEPEEKNCFTCTCDVIFRDEYQGQQNNGLQLQHKNTDATVRLHTCMQP